MKILLATPLYPPDIGGPATYARVLVAELARRGIAFEVVSFGSVRHLPAGIRHIAFLVRLLKNGKDCSVVLAQDPFSVGVPSYVASLLLRKCLVVRIPGDFAWEQGVQHFGVTEELDEFSKRKEREDYPLTVIIMRMVQRFVARKADLIIVPSKYMKRIVTNWGIVPLHIAVIPNPVEDVSNQGNRRTLRGLLQFRGKIIISVGRLVPWKGFETLIDVMPDILERFPDTKLLIVGSGPLMDALEAHAAGLGVSNQVVFTGALEREILLRYIKVSDAFVLNTSFESFSFQVLEAMSVGVPVVTTDVGSLPEIITHKKNGLLVRPNDKKALTQSIFSALGDPTLCKHLVSGGRKTVANFDASNVVSNVLEEIRRACKQ